MTAVVEVKDLKAYYRTDAYGVRRTVQAVDGVSFEVRENEVYGIAGESGCGKSTLLKVMLGMVVPPLTVLDGHVWYMLDGQPIDALTMLGQERERIRWKEVSYIPQGSMHVLNPVRRVRHTFGDFVAAHHPMPRREADHLIRAYVRDLGLSVQILDAYPHQLSGGMRQRVTIALATILRPRIVLADEPTTALDVVVQRGVIQLLKDVQQREKNTLVVVTHDMGVHANLADRIGVLYAGVLIEEADTRTIFKAPQHPYTRYLIRSLPSLEDRSARISIPGTPPALDSVPSGCRFHPRCPEAMEICKHSTPEMVPIREGHRVACFLVAGESR
ncbi:MAG: ABC transporter ATP-binding protein [Chloroflexi bacterium]|nr:ABC transporter ATP-binding protein [Chloroflexota bacterium]